MTTRARATSASGAPHEKFARRAQVFGLTGVETYLREVDESIRLFGVELKRCLELRGGELRTVQAHEDRAVIVARRGVEGRVGGGGGEVSLGLL